MVLSLVLVAASIVYAFAVSYRRGIKRRRDILQGIAKQRTGDQTWRPVIERGLAVGWALFVVSAGVGLLFPRSSWSPGPESLLVLCAVVAVSSMAYAAYLVLQLVMKRLHR
jgi:drug/metabolite transporter (DMT)-like permease